MIFYFHIYFKPATHHPSPVTRYPLPATRHPPPTTRGKVLPVNRTKPNKKSIQIQLVGLLFNWFGN